MLLVFATRYDEVTERTFGIAQRLLEQPSLGDTVRRALLESDATAERLAIEDRRATIPGHDRATSMTAKQDSALPADHDLPAWVRDAASLPVAFAQVREDPILDAQVVERLKPNARILMIASGGCTLAYLAARGRAAQIDVVDPNPAQLALARLKLYLLRHCDPADRLALLGHAPLAATQREERLRAILSTIGVPAESIGPPRLWAADGPDHTGRYEHVFAALRKHLHPHSAPIEQLLSLRDPQEQARRVAPGTSLGRALDDAFAEAMSLPILIRLFGEGATRNRVESFASHFVRRLRHVLCTLPAADNPYVWQQVRRRNDPQLRRAATRSGDTTLNRGWG